MWREAIHLVNEGVATVEAAGDGGRPHLDPTTADRLVDGLKATTGAHTVDDLAARRDALLATIVAATHGR